MTLFNRNAFAIKKVFGVYVCGNYRDKRRSSFGMAVTEEQKK